MASNQNTQADSAWKAVLNLCEYCLELVQWIVNPESGSGSHNRREFERPTKSRCKFCELLIQGHQSGTQISLSTAKTTSLIMSYCHSSLMQHEEHLLCMFEIDAQQTGVLQFAVWADEGVETMHVASFMVDWKLGTPACERFVTCPPILGPFMNEVHGLARDWLTECQSLHEACASTNQTKLPTRVLQIFGGSQTPAVKLIETKGASEGKYCALSHCWGPANKQPLRTTHENYQSHLGGINLEELPKSFRDAIMLTRGLDIEYLWIDSLCIVQDDEEDWRYEAGEMAGVYQNATLVIAAADAKDSTEGFFISERRHESTRKVPYIKKGVMEGSFNIARLPTYDSGPSESHLNTRAWAFQERLLARRIIFFARGGISWKCSKLETRERSSGEDLGFYESQSWLHLLEQYSRKRMTNAGDRLHALRGITLEMQKTRTDHFNPVYGIWEARIYAQLLWRRNKTLIEAEVLDLPTWTWAATGGAKIWCDPDMEQGTLQAMPKVLDLSASGALVSSAYCSRRPLALRYLATGDWTSSFHPDSYSDGFLEKYMLPGGWGREDYPVYAIEAVSSGTRILGISVFDREPSTSATCFFVARHERHRVSDIDEVSYASRSHREREGIDSECAHDGEGYHEGSPSSNDGWDPDCATEANPNSSEADEPYATIKTTIGKGNGSRLRKFIQHTMSSDAMDSMDPEDVAIIIEMLHLSDITEFVYWCLLLEPAGEGKYKRVGLAMLYPHAFEALGAEEMHFEII